jgi:hypothetical protein
MAPRITAGFDRAAWEALEVSSPLLRAEWLEVMSSRLPGAVHTITDRAGVGFLGTVVRDPAAYEAYNPYAILWRHPAVFELADPDRRRRALAARPVEAAQVLPALALVAPGYIGDPAGAAARSPDAVRACLTGIVDWCRDRGLAAAYVLYCGDSAATVEAATAALHGVRFPLTTRWRLPVWWDDWDGYLAGLTAARAKEIRRELRRAGEAGVRTRPIDVAGNVEEIVRARCDLLAGYGQAADVAAETRRLRGLLRTFGTDLTGYAAYTGDELIAATVCVRHGRSMHVVYTGTTRAGRALPFVHFLACFYAVIQDVRRGDLDEIDYGIGHGAGKRLRGCHGRPTYGYALTGDPDRRATVARAAALLVECAPAVPN